MTQLHTVREVIDALDGTPGIGQLTGANAKAISAWRSHDRFPWKTYPAITEALRKQGKSAAETLWGMKAKESAA